VRTFCGQGGSLDADVRTFWCKTSYDFSKFMVYPHEQGGLSRFGQREINYSRFCADVFYGRPLIIKLELYFEEHFR